MKLYAFNLGASRPGLIYKTLLIMKLIIIIMTGFLLQASASTFAQKISYTKKDATIREVLQQITKQTGYEVLYADKKLRDSKKLNVNFKQTDLKVVLNQCLEGLSLAYTIEDKVIVIKPEEQTILGKITVAIKNAFLKIRVKGKILNEEGKPLSQATI
jgi:type II secretory pathway component GspD/PulD (secretin)